MAFKRITSIQEVDILAEIGAPRCLMVADADIDCDGPNGNPDGDKYWQPETSLKLHGNSIDSYKVPGVVLPPQAIKGVPGVVLGCQARIMNHATGKACVAVVYDIGPTSKVGEISVEAARRIGLPHNPNTGGTSDFDQISYEWWPGVPAQVDGITYQLQPFTRP